MVLYLEFTPRRDEFPGNGISGMGNVPFPSYPDPGIPGWDEVYVYVHIEWVL